ncbi:unnamed protein product, partial [Mesorhabditis belari]|uniref:SSD domain-containing protein n=1 Tax=Mesorhabditis belari TaxID=2138241 RepID=A0AAF3EA46_9BILA
MINFQSIVSQFFECLSLCIVKRPLPFLLLPPLFTFLLIAFASYDFRLNVSTDTLKVFLPDEIESLQNLNELMRLFPPSDPQRDSYSVLGSKFAYTTLEDFSTERNIISNKNLQKLAKLHRFVSSVKTNTGVTYQSVCLRSSPTDGCIQHPLAFALEDSDPQLSIGFMLRYPQFVIANSSIDYAMMLGGVKVKKPTDKHGNGAVMSARALRLYYLLDFSSKADEWIETFLKEVTKVELGNTKLFYSSSRSLPKEIERNGELLIPWIPVMILVLVVLCMGICCERDVVRSQPIVGLAALLCALLATISALALLIGTHYPFLPLVTIMPFLIISIGVDNAFLLLKSWRLQEANLSAEDRFVSAVTETSASLLLTSLTDGLSFSIGSLSDFHAVRVFCTYCALAVLFLFIYQVTFFSAAMLILCRREIAQRHCIFMWKKVKVRKPESDRSSCGSQRQIMPKQKESSSVGESLAALIQQPCSKFLILLTYFGYLGLSIYYCARLPIGLDLKDLTPDGSYVAEELASQERLFNDYGQFCFAVIDTSSIRLWELDDRKRLISLYKKLGSERYASTYEFWLLKFDEVLPKKSVNEAFFMQKLMWFLRQKQFEHFKKDIRFTGSGTISHVKMLFRLRHLSPTTDAPRRTFMTSTIEKSKFQGFAYDTSFLLVEQQAASVKAVLSNAAQACVAMLLICMILVPRLVSSLCIAAAIVSINVGVVGCLSAAGTRLDIISMITIVMSIGFSVDYVAHSTFHFVIHRHDRLKHSLGVTCAPIWQAALSTVAGVLMLIAVPSYIVRTFVYTTVFVVLIGVAHGLVFLPALLDSVVPLSEFLEPYQPKKSSNSRGNTRKIFNTHNRLDCYGKRDFQLSKPVTQEKIYCEPPRLDVPATPPRLLPQNIPIYENTRTHHLSTRKY